MGVYIWNRLPSEYQEVEWIKSSGTQWIDSGVKVSNNTKIISKLFNSDNGTYANIFGVYRAGYYFSFGLINSSAFYRARIRSGSSANSTVDSSILPSTTPHIFEMSQAGGFYIDGTKIGTFTSYTFTETYNLYIFAGNNYRDNVADGIGNTTIYYMQIYEGSTLIRDFIPCYRKSDSVIGLYDLVNNQFYTNSGSGTFSKGSDVNTYRESSLKNAYIGEVGEYTISNIPTTDTNVYVNVARSGKTIQSVKFNFIATGDGAYVHISGNNSNSNRYGVGCGRNTSNTSADLCAIRGRLNGASDTYYRTVSYSRSGANQIEFYINRDGNCYITVNGTKTTYTAGTAELNIIQTIMNLSNMNVYASQNGACLTGNKVDVEVTYS